MYTSQRIITTKLLSGVGGARERFFRKMELLEFEEEEENIAFIDIHDVNTDLFFEEDKEDVFDLISNCDGNPVSHLVYYVCQILGSHAGHLFVADPAKWVNLRPQIENLRLETQELLFLSSANIV